MSVKIIYKEIPQGAAEGAEVMAQGQTETSDLARLPFGYDNQKKYATLERNMWALNSDRAIYGGEKFSFWSEALSDDNGYFDIPPEISIILDNYYSSGGIYIDFGTMGYCTEVAVAWYRGTEVLHGETYYPNANGFYCNARVEAYNKVVLRLIRTSHTHERARINAVYFGLARTFRRDQLRSVKITQQINLISNELPENVLDWQLNSAELVEYLFQLKQPVEAYDGDKLIGAFYIKSSDRKGPRLYNIKCTDAIGVLDEDAFPSVYLKNKNAYELAQEICANFGVEMQESLKDKTVTGVLYDVTRREALQQLCFAIGAVADTSGTQNVKIFVPASANPKEIGKSRVRVGGALKTSDLVTEVQLTAHNFSTSGNGESYEINGVTYFDVPTIYSRKNPNATEGDKVNVISITDAMLIDTSNAEDILDRVYNYYMMRNTHKVSFRLEGEQIGDYVSTPTNWDDTITGNYVKATLSLSGIVVASAEVVGN